MALSKSVEVNGTGVYAVYWRVIDIRANFPAIEGDVGDVTGTLAITLQGFIDKDTRDLGKNALMTREFHFDSNDLGGNLDGLSRSAVYALIKAMVSDFHDAVDV